MPDNREQERRQQMAKTVNADGSMAPASPGLWTTEDQRDLEDDFDGVLRDEINEEADRLIRQAVEDEQHPQAEFQRLIALADPSVLYTPGQEILTMTDFNNAVAELLSRPHIPTPRTPEQERREYAEAKARMKRYFGPPTPEQDAEAPSAGYMPTTIDDRRAATALMPLQPDFDLSTPALEQQLLATFGSPEIVRAWLNTLNPVLGGETPGAYLERGDEAAIRKLLMMAETGQPT